MKLYKYELHCHTAEVSKCATATAEDVVKFYKENGYDGIVITDHYSVATFKGRNLFSPQDESEFFMEGYRKAKEAAGDDFTVLFGLELRYYLNGNDYLIYGADESFIRDNGNLMALYPRRLHNLAQEKGALVVQAHPFRPYLYRTEAAYLDGCEVYNAKDRHKDYNNKAYNWANHNGIRILTAGGDFHRESHIKNMSGIQTKQKITTNDDLLKVLKSGNYSILKRRSHRS